MSDFKFNPRTAILLLFIVLISIIRIAAPLSEGTKGIANFSAVGAIALFGGAYFNTNMKAFGFPMLVLLLSDFFIAKTSGYGFFYAGWYWTYIAFILMVLVGKVILTKINVQSFLISTFVGVFIHWIVADISAMYIPNLYPPTIAGFWACLVAAIPFELNFLYGTLAYGAVMFGAFELLKSKYPYLSLSKSVTA
ncbi:DUF6580 family putative transport protein [Pedobacter sp. MC2016-24]|uniref:DUF6580 family putative transport protein n=1 Tax=Pedobacter sp. MC2016-24 TaxID=2780090 RepID=UPI0018810540|nr:DUF6580 family putative transport protein [Pedobacter sp. MC2016-24]MBE9600969.1 hypothetical protein [Pedobacter sp. MC2016-24]